jgi:hypothetical protein
VLLPTTGLNVGGTAPNYTLSLTPDRNQSGSAQVTLTASDGSRATNATFSVTVTPSNSDPSELLYLTGVQPVSAEAWRFHLVDLGTASTNYVVEYRSDLSPTNVWITATNVTALGGGAFEVNTAPQQDDSGFYRVKGIRWLTAGVGSSALSGAEGTVSGPVMFFNGVYNGVLSYTWAGTWGTTNGTVLVNGTTVVIPIPAGFMADNTGLGQMQFLTLRLGTGIGYALAGGTQADVTIEDNDADWQGTLTIPNGLAGTVTASLTNQAVGGYTSVSLPQNGNTILSFILRVQQSNGNLQGQLRTDGYGFFPTNTLAQLSLTEDSFTAVATNVPLPAPPNSPLFSATNYLSLRLDAANAPGQTNVSPSQISGTATLVSAVPGRPYLDTALSGPFLLLRPPRVPSTNEASFHSTP